MKKPGHRPGLLPRKKPLRAAALKLPLAIPPRPQAGASWLFPVKVVCGQAVQRLGDVFRHHVAGLLQRQPFHHASQRVAAGDSRSTAVGHKLGRLNPLAVQPQVKLHHIAAPAHRPAVGIRRIHPPDVAGVISLVDELG